jgi:hypothetical protein
MSLQKQKNPDTKKKLESQKPDYIIVSFFEDLAGKSIVDIFNKLSDEEKVIFSGYYEIKLTDKNEIGYTERFDFFEKNPDNEIIEGFIRETMENDCIIFKGVCDYVMIMKIMSILIGKFVNMETASKFKCINPKNPEKVVFINLISEWTV